MELREKLKKIMNDEFGIQTEKQLNEAFEALDLSEYSIFTSKVRKENNNA